MHKGWFRRARLAERAFLLREMDKAILREGGVHNLPVEALKKCCYIRGKLGIVISKLNFCHSQG